MPVCRPLFAVRLTSLIITAAGGAYALLGGGGSEAAELPAKTLDRKSVV